ncbi:MAG TPA: site-2 protease family protein [Ruminiclostridium sp.]
MNIRIKRILISIDILIVPLIVIALLKDFFVQYIITIVFIIAHELGHIVTALFSGAKIYRLRILPIGLNAEIDDSLCSKYRKIYIYMAGPCINIISAIVIYILYASHFVSKELTLGVYINMWLAFFNLLPILPLDGGKIAMEMLSEHFGLFKASKKMHILSVLLSIVVICLGLMVFKQSQYNFSLVLVGIYILVCNRKSKKETAFMNIKNFVYRRAKIIRKGIYPAREIVVMKNVKLSEVIKAMDYANMFHLVNVLDENLRLIKVMTEQEILDALMLNSIDTTFDKLLTISQD